MSQEPPHYRVSRIAKELEASGRDVIHMEIGDPELDTDPRIVDAMCRAAREGHTHYAPTRGVKPLLERLVGYMERFIKPGFDLSIDNIVVTPGSKVAIYTALRLLRPRRIFVVEPMWGLYHSFASEMGIEIVHIPTRMEDGWELRTEINGVEKGDVIAVVNPNNPTGTILSRESISNILETAREADAYILADEVYFDLIYRGSMTSFLSMDYDRVLAFYTFSKNFVMSGFRVGWVVSPSKDLANNFLNRLRLIVGGPPPFSQYGAAEALTLMDVLEKNRRFYMETLQYSVERLREMGFRFVEPSAGMYIFAEPPVEEMDGVEFTYRLLEEEAVAVAPGTGFGDYPGYVRFTTSLRMERLEEAFNRIERFLERR